VSTRQIAIVAVVDLDANAYPPDDEQAERWLINDILKGAVPGSLSLHSDEIGDVIGTVTVRAVSVREPQ
jgi:hypothetical protein